MRDKVYKMTTLTATSSESYEQAIRNGVKTSSEKVRNLAWFQVEDFRGAINEDGEVAEFQAKMTLAFEVDQG